MKLFQFEILKKLVKDNSILVVGDDCQSIYSFRAAEIANILSFQNFFRNSRKYVLTINYRCNPEIVNLINKSIKNNDERFEKELKTFKKSGYLPLLVQCVDVTQESEFVCQKIKSAIKTGFSLKNIGILYRAEYQSANLELMFMGRRIPFVKRGGLRFFEQAHIKDITAFLKIFSNPYDIIAWKRTLCLFVGIGEQTAEKIFYEITKVDAFSFIKAHREPRISKRAMDSWTEFKKLFLRTLDAGTEPSTAANMLLQNFYFEYLKRSHARFKDRIQDIQQYINMAAKYETLEVFLEDITLDADLTNSEKRQKAKDAVVLSTIHQAKGLEWDKVFILSVVEGRFPSKRACDEGNIEEERRLFYVACSRAKNELYLCRPIKDFTFWTGNIIMDDSVFIEELPDKTYELMNISKKGIKSSFN